MKSPDWTIIKLLQWTTTYFKERGIESPRIDAELLLAFALGLERIDLYLRYDQPLHKEELAVFRGLVKRRAAREPVAYITGTKEFWGLAMAVEPAVLIPRPETECLIEAVLEFIEAYPDSDHPYMLDLGTGTGAIALALAHSCPAARIVALDRSIEALAVANRNRLGHHLQDRVDLLAGEWLAAIDRHSPWFDVITSNPPYIPSGHLQGLQPEIVQYEPHLALDGGVDGLNCLRVIVREAPALLRSGGGLFLEIGHDQFAAVQQMSEASGAYGEVTCIKDYSGLDRVARLKRA